MDDARQPTMPSSPPPKLPNGARQHLSSLASCNTAKAAARIDAHKRAGNHTERASVMHRRTFTEEEKAVLENAFSAAPSTYGDVAQSVANTLQIPYERVRKWFDNREPASLTQAHYEPALSQTMVRILSRL